MRLSVLRALFLILLIAFLLPVGSPAQFVYDNCDFETCDAEAKKAEAEKDRICYGQSPEKTNWDACYVARLKWSALIALNCRRKANSEADKDDQTLPPLKQAKVCPPDPPLPSTAASFNRDYIENVVLPLLDAIPSSIPLKNKLLVFGHAYSESAPGFRDKETKAFGALQDNDLFNLQYNTQAECPGKCKQVPRGECLTATDPKNPQSAVPIPPNPQQNVLYIGKTPGTVCFWTVKQVWVKSYATINESLDFYMSFEGGNFLNIQNRLKDGSASPTDILKTMSGFGTSPDYYKNLVMGTRQIIWAILKYAEGKINALGKRIKCEVAGKAEPTVIQALQEEKSNFETLYKTAVSTYNNLPKTPE